MIIGNIETNEKVEYEDLLKNYYEKMEIIEEQDKKIERLKEINKELGRDYSSANNGYLRLHSIIKEVREYIEKMEKLHFDYSYEKQELLEILDKENK